MLTPFKEHNMPEKPIEKPLDQMTANELLIRLVTEAGYQSEQAAKQRELLESIKGHLRFFTIIILLTILFSVVDVLVRTGVLRY
jgi:hypothetical protein